jgi:hypothetical protein
VNEIQDIGDFSNKSGGWKGKGCSWGAGTEKREAIDIMHRQSEHLIYKEKSGYN